jgi:hypothetical protein
LTQIWLGPQVWLPQATLLASAISGSQLASAVASEPASAGQELTSNMPCGQPQQPYSTGVSPHCVTHRAGAKQGVDEQSPPLPPIPPAPGSPVPEELQATMSVALNAQPMRIMARSRKQASCLAKLVKFSASRRARWHILRQVRDA